MLNSHPHLIQYLQSKELSIIEFLSFSFPPSSPSGPRLLRVEKYFSTLTPTTKDIGHAVKFPLPPDNVITRLSDLVNTRTTEMSILCPHVSSAGGHLFPVSLVEYWNETIHQREVQEQWRKAVFNIREMGKRKKLQPMVLNEIEDVLSTLPWTGPLHGFRNSVTLDRLSFFLTSEWLHDDHELLLLNMLQEDLTQTGNNHVFVEDPAFMLLLSGAFAEKGEYNTDQAYNWMRSRGQKLAAGDKRYLVTIVNHNNRHWTGLVIDFQEDIILHADSFGRPLPARVQSVLIWWTKIHTSRVFGIRGLPVIAQSDGHSCGMLSWFAIHNHLLPGFLKATEGIVGRANIFLKLIGYHNGRKQDDPPTYSSIFECDSTTSGFVEHSLDPEYQKFSESSSETDDELPVWPIFSKREAQEDTKVEGPKAKRICTEKSSIRRALEKEGPPTGLLRFFRKATDEEHQQHVHQSMEDVRERTETLETIKLKDDLRKQRLQRKRATERKRLQRARMRDQEVSAGIRSPGGKKRQIKVPELKYACKFDQGGSVAELSRPARVLKEHWKEHARKPQGRKRLRPSQSTVYTNWLAPFLWKDIEKARVFVGGPTWSTTAMVKYLQRRDPETFKALRRTTVDEWIDRSNETPKWRDSVLERVRRGNDTANLKGGRKGVLAGHPEVIETAKTIIKTIRGTGAIITLVTARGILLAVIIRTAPEILTTTFPDGSTFQASESFIRKWLRDTVGYSRRRATQAAQKLPDDWEEQCERAAIRRAYLIKEEDIIAELIVNSDQTQVLYAPGDKLTWAEKGVKQVAVLGAEEKRAFTALISVASDGTFLPVQAIYSGKTPRSCPSSDSPNHSDLVRVGCLLQESGTKTYWSNINTMKDFVNGILAPYFDRQKASLGLSSSQKSLWIIDVWSVHRSVEFRTWMKTSHPSIILDFVPGGCTGVAQPCDVGIQRPFKHSIKRSYHEDVVANILHQMDESNEIVGLDTHLGVLRNSSTRWLWNAYQALSNKELVKKAFEHCRVRRWDLSYATLTGMEIRAHLRELRTADPDFWQELTLRNSDTALPPENIPQPEDDPNNEGSHADDDSDVPNQVVIQSMVNPSAREEDGRYMVGENGGLVAKDGVMAEGYGEDDPTGINVVGDEELGRGKRHKVPNQRYLGFWKHDDATASEADD